jgi:hypothetical protein
VATDPETQGQHLVSRGLQQNFADDRRVVAVLDAQSGDTLDPERPIKTNWRMDDILTVRHPTGALDRSQEKRFAKNGGEGVRPDPPHCVA